MVRPGSAVLAAIAVLLMACAGDESGVVDEQGAAEAAPAPEAETGSDADDTPDPRSTASRGTAPRADISIFPGADLVHERVLAAAVEEVWAVDAPLEEVIEFYSSMPGLEELPDSALTGDDGGGYLELEIFSLARDGETDPAVYEAAVAAAEYGPLLRIAVVTAESKALVWFGGSEAQEVIPSDSTVILLGVLTG